MLMSNVGHSYLSSTGQYVKSFTFAQTLLVACVFSQCIFTYFVNKNRTEVAKMLTIYLEHFCQAQAQAGLGWLYSLLIQPPHPTQLQPWVYKVAFKWPGGRKLWSMGGKIWQTLF